MHKVLVICVLVFVGVVFVDAPCARAGTVYEIDFKIVNTGNYSAIDFTVNYASASGDFVGLGSAVACTTNASLNAVAAYNDMDPDLNVGLFRLSAIAAPVVLATCDFDATSSAPLASQFVSTIRDWTTESSGPPFVFVSRIQPK